MNEVKASDEKNLLKDGYKKYTGENVDVFYNTEICEHVGNCVRGDADVFQVGRRPWIIPDNAPVDTVVKVVNTCPTGALKYSRKQKE